MQLQRRKSSKIRSHRGNKRDFRQIDAFLKRRGPVLRLILFPAVLAYWEILLRLFSRNGFFRHLIYPIIFAVAAGLLLTVLTSAFKRKINTIITWVLMIVLPVYYTLQGFVQNAFKTYMTLGNIMKGTGDVANDFTSVLVKTIIFGIPKIVLFLLPSVWYFYKGRKYMPARRLHRPMLIAVGACYIALSIFAVVTASTGKTAGAYAAEYTYNSATQTFGLITGSRLNLKYAIFGNKKASSFAAQKAEEAKNAYKGKTNKMKIDFDKVAKKSDNETVKELCEYAAAQAPSKQNKYTGLFKDKNLIIICAEAFSDAVIDKELTPTLYRLQHKGFYFSNFYQPAWGGSTSTGEYSMLFGLVPTEGIETMLKTIGHNNYFTPGNQLQRHDYYSAAYHDGVYDFYDRHLTHQNLGYSIWQANGNGLEELTGKHIVDKNMFDKTMDTYLDKKHFSIYYMSVDGHAPYNENYRTEKYLGRVEEVLGKNAYKKKTMNYIAYQMGLEDALATMVKKLEDSGHADDTVICLTSDHYPYGLSKSHTWGNSEDYIKDLYGHAINNPWDRDKNAWILWSGSLENDDKEMWKEIKEPTYSLDILPTLSNLFGWKFDSRLLVGRDVFAGGEPLVLWNNHSWLTTWGMYNAGEGEFTAVKGKEPTEEEIENTKAIVKNKILFSKGVLETDFYGKLFGKDKKE